MKTAKESVTELELMVLDRLSKDGFKKKKKNQFIRLVDECVQDITLLEYKTRSKDEVNIMANYSFTYDNIEKCISYIQGKKYDKVWSTGTSTLCNVFNEKEYINFYINGDTDVEPLADVIIKSIKKFAYSFWEKCNTYDKFRTELFDKNTEVRWNMVLCNNEAWNKIALSLIYNDGCVDKIIGYYKDKLEDTACVVFSECVPRIERLREAFEHGTGFKLLEEYRKFGIRE